MQATLLLPGPSALPVAGPETMLPPMLSPGLGGHAAELLRT